MHRYQEHSRKNTLRGQRGDSISEPGWLARTQAEKRTPSTKRAVHPRYRDGKKTISVRLFRENAKEGTMPKGKAHERIEEGNGGKSWAQAQTRKAVG